MEGFVSLYDPSERTMKILHNFSDDTDLILHEYMHHVLKISDLEPFAKKSWWSYLAIEHGLAVYFTASFNNRAVFGRGKYRSDLNSHLVYSKKPFKENSIHSEGEPLWGGAFWQIRKFLGNVKADKLIAEAWISLQPLKTPERFSEDFMERLILLASKINDENAEKVKEILADRGLLSNK